MPLNNRPVGLAGTLAVAAVAVATLFAGTLSVHGVLVELLHRSARLRSAQSELQDVLLARSDETADAGALAVSGHRRDARRLLLATAQMRTGVNELTMELVALKMPRSVAAARSLGADVDTWDLIVRHHTLSRIDARLEISLRRRILDDVFEIEKRLKAESVAAEGRIEDDADRTIALAALASGLVVGFALVAIRQRAAYAAEKHVTDALRRAFGPTDLPHTDSIRIDALSLPAARNAQVGGDWCDAYVLPDGRIFFSIGDVAGHGVVAAVGMSRARQSLLAASLSETDPAVVLKRVNAVLSVQRAGLVTAICGYVDPDTLVVAYACAGHPPPIATESGDVRLLPYGDIPMGIHAAVNYTTQTLQARDGTMIILYTDGIVEYDHDAVAGEERLLWAARELTRKGPIATAEELLLLLIPKLSLSDDASVMLIRFAPFHVAGARPVSESPLPASSGL